MVKNRPPSAGDRRDLSLIPGLGRLPGEGNGNPFQYSCLENPMDRGAWWATVCKHSLWNIPKVDFDKMQRELRENSQQMLYCTLPEASYSHRLKIQIFQLQVQSYATSLLLSSGNSTVPNLHTTSPQRH